jgi:hypothetical protein
LIQVNDLQEKKPELISIWGIIYANTSPTNVNFISLYPTNNLENNGQLESIFAKTKKGTLTLSSFRRFTRLFDLHFDDYFLLDETATLEFASYMGIDRLATFNVSPDSVELVTSIQSREKTFFTSFCNILLSGAEQSFLSKIDWSDLTPAHFTSSLNIDELQTLMGDLSSSSEINFCRVEILQ